MGKSRGDRLVIFSSSGAAQTTSAFHLRRLPTGTSTRARVGAEADAEAPMEPGAAATGGAAAGAERHHGDAMGARSSRALDSLGPLDGGVGLEFGFRLRVAWYWSGGGL